jgi:hypothetical protein
MWRIDPTGGCRFAYSDNPDQLLLFDAAPDLAPLEASLRKRFGTAPFTIRQAVIHTATDTPFASRMVASECCWKSLTAQALRLR